ncbi:MAG: tetratricopeptide repeat protein [Beijerinckiaceae bacterium]
MTKFRRSVSLVALCCAVGLIAASCAKITKRNDITGSIAPSARSEAEWRQQSDLWAKRYDAQPGDRTASLNYAQALRALGQREQAAAVLQQAAARSPQDKEVIGAYGRALADAGRLEEAMAVLPRAHTPERPDWRIYSAQGVIADKLGEHDKAKSFYQSALEIAPQEAAIHSNLGFSYALSKRLPEAEDILRRAAAMPGADARVRQNLVLVLGLQGKFSEAEQISLKDMSPDDAAQNIAYLRKTLAQPNSWDKIRATQVNRSKPAKQSRTIGSAADKADIGTQSIE